MRHDNKPLLCDTECNNNNYMPCKVDRYTFNNIYDAYDYLMQVNGRIPFDMLKRFLKRSIKTGRRLCIGGNFIESLCTVYDKKGKAIYNTQEGGY